MSIRLRLTLYWAAVTTAILLAAGLFMMVSFSRQTWNALDEALLEEADTTATAVSQSSSEEAIVILRHLSAEKDLGPARRVRLSVAGTTIFDEGDRTTDVPAGQVRSGTSTVVEDERHVYRFAVTSFRLSGQNAVLWDGVDATPIRDSIARLRRGLLLLLPVILVLCVVGGYCLSASALNPVNALARALARIGPEDLKQRLPSARLRDEAGRLVEEINRLLGRLEAASAARRQFISEAAHELRTPLTVLRSGLEVALQRVRSAEESRSAVEDALSEVERLCATAEDLLALARLDAVAVLKRESVDLGQVVRDSADTARVLAEAKHQTLTVDANTPLVVEGDANDLRRMALNLLDNAIKFTPEKGRIAVAVTRQQRYALLAVSDSGPGVEAHDLGRLFDPFYRGRTSNGDGSGLGLALCLQIVRMHEGSISAANKEGGGCEVQVRLPLAAEKEAESKAAQN